MERSVDHVTDDIPVGQFQSSLSDDESPLPPARHLDLEQPKRPEPDKHVGTLPNVFCFYEKALARDELPLIAMWKANWAKYGWNPQVLNRASVLSHPGYRYFTIKIAQLPCINPRPYEEFCFLRHLAMANVGGGLLVDYDVFNFGLSPAWVEKNLPFTHVPVLLEPTRVPCAVYGSPAAYEHICDLIDTYEPRPDDTYKGRPHVSDMVIIRRSTLPVIKVCVECRCTGSEQPNDFGDGWQSAKLIHFSTQSMYLRSRGTKHGLIGRTIREFNLPA